jgi:DNA-binding NtrC family response regulator
MLRIKSVIAKLEKQRRDLKEIIAVLRQIEAGPRNVHRDASLDDSEKRLVMRALAQADGNQTEAARILQVSRDRLRYKIAKHGLIRK